MKILCLILLFSLHAIAYSQANAGPDKVNCNGNGVEIGDATEYPKSCYSCKTIPEDDAVK